MMPFLQDLFKKENIQQPTTPAIVPTEFLLTNPASFRFMNTSSLPVITDIHKQTKAVTQKIHEGSVVKTAIMNEISQINQVAFADGINIDEYELINDGSGKFDTATLSQLLKNGVIFPLSTTRGIFLPLDLFPDNIDCVVSYTFRTTTAGIIRPYDSLVQEPLQRFFTIEAKNIVPPTLSPLCVVQPKLLKKPGREEVSLHFAPAPLTHLFYLLNCCFLTWFKLNHIHRLDIVDSHAAHCHVTIPLPTSQKNTNEYIKELKNLISSRYTVQVDEKINSLRLSCYMPVGLLPPIVTLCLLATKVRTEILAGSSHPLTMINQNVKTAPYLQWLHSFNKMFTEPEEN